MLAPQMTVFRDEPAMPDLFGRRRRGSKSALVHRVTSARSAAGPIAPNSRRDAETRERSGATEIADTRTGGLRRRTSAIVEICFGTARDEVCNWSQELDNFHPSRRPPVVYYARINGWKRMALEAHRRFDKRIARRLVRLFSLAQLSATLAATLTLALPAVAEDQPTFPGREWQTARPEKLGWSVRRLLEAKDYAEEIGSTAVLIVQDGKIVAQWGDVRKKVNIYSMRKSIMSALYGVAVAKHQIDLDKTLAEIGIDDKPPALTAVEKTATVRDLLKARSGIYHAASFETNSMKERRPERGSHAPGTFWYYNNWDFNVAGAILRRATGEDTFAAVGQYLARPVGMEDFVPEDGRYVYDKSTDHPAYPMRFTARDLARFGWLYLNGGTWRDQQVIPAEWIRESTRSYSNTDRGTGYGYMWWVAKRGIQFRTDVGRGAFSARGNGGQYIIVAPEQRIVVVHLRDRTARGRLKKGRFARLLRLIFDAAPRS